MPATVKQIKDSFDVLYRNILDSEFRNTYMMNQWNERDLLLCIRTFLLGWFGNVKPEHQTRKFSATGYADFLVDDVAVEVAVQPEGKPIGRLYYEQNKDECIKLMQHKSASALVLLDFMQAPSLSLKRISRYRNPPSLGSGNWNTSGFSVLYYSMRDGAPTSTRINVCRPSVY